MLKLELMLVLRFKLNCSNFIFRLTFEVCSFKTSSIKVIGPSSIKKVFEKLLMKWSKTQKVVYYSSFKYDGCVLDHLILCSPS